MLRKKQVNVMAELLNIIIRRFRNGKEIQLDFTDDFHIAAKLKSYKLCDVADSLELLAHEVRKKANENG